MEHTLGDGSLRYCRDNTTGKLTSLINRGGHIGKDIHPDLAVLDCRIIVCPYHHTCRVRGLDNRIVDGLHLDITYLSRLTINGEGQRCNGVGSRCRILGSNKVLHHKNSHVVYFALNIVKYHCLGRDCLAVAIQFVVYIARRILNGDILGQAIALLFIVVRITC